VILPEAEAGLIVEFTGAAAGDVLQRLQDMQKVLRSAGIDFRVTRIAGSFEETELLWSLPARVVSLLASLRGESRPLPFVEDIAVPPEQLAPFLQTAQRIFQKHEVTASLYAHAASGQLHFRPILPVPSRGEPTKLTAIASDLYQQVLLAGGTISGEHGDGLSRTPFVAQQYGPLYHVFEEVRKLFDPLLLLNPDKITSSGTQPVTQWLRRTRPADASATTATEPLLPTLQLNWSAEQASAAAVRCNGCGSCRVHEPAGRMCPFVTDGTSEELAPRAKAALLRRGICADSSSDLLQSESVRSVIESCFNCKQCQLECPSEVDIPRIVLEARAQFVRAHGLSRTQWLLSRVQTWAPLLSRFAFIANPLLRYRSVRLLLQRLVGIAAARRLPSFARRSFLDSPRVRREDNNGAPGSPLPTVVYFVDYFANFHDPELAEAFCRVLEHNGFRVYIPRGQTVSGMSMVSAADLDAARSAAERNLRELAEPAREGYPILCTEPSAALCISREYPFLINSDDAKEVAARTSDAGKFLLELLRSGKLRRDFTPLPVRLAWHTPCHIRALGPDAGLLEILRLIPNLEIVPIEKGCTGMAGTFGLAAQNFEQSLRIGSDLMNAINTVDAVAGTTDCSSCRMQMEQQASIPTIHPIKLLALSYGLMPRLAERLKQRPSGLSLSR
jgi:Fe-S oxidoreductase